MKVNWMIIKHLTIICAGSQYSNWIPTTCTACINYFITLAPSLCAVQQEMLTSKQAIVIVREEYQNRTRPWFLREGAPNPHVIRTSFPRLQITRHTRYPDPGGKKTFEFSILREQKNKEYFRLQPRNIVYLFRMEFYLHVKIYPAWIRAMWERTKKKKKKVPTTTTLAKKCIFTG